MSDKPVYQLRYGTGDVDVTEEQYFRESYMRGTPRRMLYPASVVEALKAENESQAKRIAELESEIGWINSLQGEDVMYETILARAKQSYIRHKYSVRGQILTRDDDLQTHIIHAAIEYAASKNGDSK